MRREEGFALMWAMFLVVLAGALGAVVLERDLTLRREGSTDEEALAAFHAAEGGLARARHELARDPRWRGGAFQVGACRVIVRVEPEGEGAWRVQVDATPGAAHRVATIAHPPRSSSEPRAAHRKDASGVRR